MEDFNFTANDPLRPPDWRSRLAQQLDKQRRFLSRGEYDFPTRSFARYLEIRREHGVGAVSCLMDGEYIHGAHEIHSNRPQLRAAIERAVLAGAPPASIAAEVGISLRCLTLFEAVFWDVRSRLSAAGFIVHDVIAAVREQDAAASEQAASKLRAYLVAGTAAEEAMHVKKHASAELLMATMEQEIHLEVREKLRRATKMLTIDSSTAARFLQADQSRSAKSAEPLLNDYETHVKAMLDTIRFRVGPDKDDDSPLAELDASAVEVNIHEMLYMAAYGELPNAEVLRTLSFDVAAPNFGPNIISPPAEPDETI